MLRPSRRSRALRCTSEGRRRRRSSRRCRLTARSCGHHHSRCHARRGRHGRTARRPTGPSRRCRRRASAAAAMRRRRRRRRRRGGNGEPRASRLARGRIVCRQPTARRSSGRDRGRRRRPAPTVSRLASRRHGGGSSDATLGTHRDHRGGAGAGAGGGRTSADIAGGAVLSAAGHDTARMRRQRSLAGLDGHRNVYSDSRVVVRLRMLRCRAVVAHAVAAPGGAHRRINVGAIGGSCAVGTVQHAA